MKKIMTLLIIGFLWGACTDNIDTPATENGDHTEEVSVKLVITVPTSAAYVQTRGAATTTDHETLISEIQLLVFESGKYKYRVPGISISNNTVTTSFTALLKSSNAPLKLLILANSTDAVLAGEPSVDDTEDVVKKKIEREFDNITSNFPMYGEYELTDGLSATAINNITGIKMLRAIARVDVKATEVTNFKLTGVKAYRANNRLQIIPNETGVLRVTTPSVPDGSSGNVNSNMFTVADEDLNEFSARLYLPEVNSPDADNRVSQATCIVVEGYYNGSTQLSYYRMDFDPDNVDNAFGQVLRNHKYIFNIKKVSAPGWDNPDEAANNRSAHIIAEVQAWDDNTIDMSFDGEHHFGVSTREILLKNRVGSNGIIYVSTDLPDYTLQWADADGTPQGTESQSLANDYFTVTKAQSGTQLIITALQSNAAGSDRRTQSFIVTAQRWRILVNIQQGYDVAAYRAINLLTFYSGLGYLGTNLVGSVNAESRATGLRGILTNQSNFGPNGTVECGGYNLIRVNTSNNNLPDALFTPFDVVYVHYMSNGVFGNLDAQKVHNWLKSKKNRVLIVSYDAADVSQHLLDEILGGNSGINYMIRNTGAYPLAAPIAENSYFTTTGPFTSGTNTPVKSTFSLRNYDLYHGEILLNTDAAKGVTPILMGPEGGIVLGVDYSRRIVYWGDTDLGSSLTGIGGTDDNRINNNAGTINNDASKLIANVFAWITETVLYGE
ncbi:fimbrial protein [Phocaeicola sp.]